MKREYATNFYAKYGSAHRLLLTRAEVVEMRGKTAPLLRKLRLSHRGSGFGRTIT